MCCIPHTVSARGGLGAPGAGDVCQEGGGRAAQGRILGLCVCVGGGGGGGGEREYGLD